MTTIALCACQQVSELTSRPRPTMSDSKSVKTALKEARDLIDKKEFKGALSACKRALNVDKDNYLALVFIGLCCSEIDQPERARESYLKAINVDPDQLPAWQGLVKFGEKNVSKQPELKSDLIKAYEHLTKVHAQAKTLDKFWSCSEKWWQALIADNDRYEDAIEVLEKQIEVMDHDQCKQRESRANVIRLLNERQGVLGQEGQDRLLRHLQAAIQDHDQSIQNLENLKIKIKLLYKMRKMEELLTTALQMHQLFPGNVYPLEWICKVHLEWVSGYLDFKNEALETDQVEKMTDKLLDLNSNSFLGGWSQAAIAFRRSDYQNAAKLMERVTESNSSSNFYGSLLHCKCLFKLKEYGKLEEQVNQAKLLLSKVHLETTRQALEQELDVMLLQSLYWQFSSLKHDQARVLLDTTVTTTSPELRVLKLKLQAKDLTVTEIDSEGLSPDEVNLVKAIRAEASGNSDQALELLEAVLGEDADNFEAHLLLGKIHYDRTQLKSSLSSFLKAAKLNPGCSVPFLYLGHHYAKLADLDKARKCYLKAFQLDKNCDEAGASVSDIYRQQDQLEKNMEFLTATAQTFAQVPLWLLIRLGVLHLDRSEPSKAITYLQAASRTSSMSPEMEQNVWETLGDAYLARGSHTSALKAYDRVLVHNSKSYYAQYQMANIKLLLGESTEAIEAFQKVFDIYPNYVPALKGLAEALSVQAETWLEERLDLKALANCCRALGVLVQAVKARPDLGCLWHLMGRIATLTRVLPPERFEGFQVPAVLVNVKDANVDDCFELGQDGKEVMLQLATRCYLKSLALMSESGDTLTSAWHDLALVYHERSELTTDASERSKLKSNAMLAIKKAITLQPNNPDCWNLLGLLSCHGDDFALGQHSFIRSVSLNNNAMAWTGLGVLYFLMGEPSLSNQALKEGQSQDPSYLRSWVGQALLAEQAEVEGEAMDLFRHATVLGNEDESSLGFGNWVCKTLRAIGTSGAKVNARNKYCLEKLYGSSLAVDCLDKFTRRHQTDSCSLNMFGLVLEAEGLFRSARQVYVKAAENQNDSKLLDEILINLGRVCFKMKLFDEAIDAFSKVSNPSFNSTCGLAAASFKANKIQESYMAYTKTLTMAEAGHFKADILATMATIALKVQGPDAAKTLLFQSCQVTPVSVRGLLALCVLGIKQKNNQLMQAALKELKGHRDDPNHEASISTVEAAVAFMSSGNFTSARRIFAKQLHKSPTNQDLWLAFAKATTRETSSTDNDLQTASICAAKAAGLAQLCKQDASEALRLTALALLKMKARGKARQGQRLAAKAVHLRPDDQSLWKLFELSRRI